MHIWIHWWTDVAFSKCFTHGIFFVCVWERDRECVCDDDWTTVAITVRLLSPGKKTSLISQRKMYMCSSMRAISNGPGWLLRWTQLYMRLCMCSTLLQDGQTCSTSLQESTQNGIRQQGQKLRRGIGMKVTQEQQNQEKANMSTISLNYNVQSYKPFWWCSQIIKPPP